MIIVEAELPRRRLGAKVKAGDLDGALNFSPLDAKLARGCVDPALRSPCALRVFWHLQFRRNLRRNYAVQLDPTRRELVPLEDRQLGAMQVLGDLP